MPTLSVRLPAQLDGDLSALARRRHATRSALVREAVAALVRAHGCSLAAVGGDLVGAIDGPADLSMSPDHLGGYGE